MKKNLLIVLLAIISINFSNAQNWSDVFGTWSKGLTVHNGALFASTLGTGPYMSNNGVLWNQMANGLTGLGPQGDGIASCGAYIYYGSKGDIHRSNDNGINWTSANTGITVSSSNFGRYFYEFNGVYYVAMSAAATNGGGLWRSLDGVAWNQVTLGSSPGVSAYTMAEIGGKLYVGSNLDLFESSDNGATWNGVGTNGSKVYNGLIEYKGRRLIHTTFGLEYSDDNGVTWDTLTSAIKSSTYCGFVEGNNDTLYAWTASNGVFLSVDTGNTWVDISGNLTSTEILFLQGCKYFNNRLYIASSTVKILGDSPTGIANNLNDQDLYCFPNPFNNQLTITNEKGDYITLNLIDATGKTILSKSSKNNKINLETNSLSKGIYLLKLIDSETGNVIKTSKVLKQ